MQGWRASSIFVFTSLLLVSVPLWDLQATSGIAAGAASADCVAVRVTMDAPGGSSIILQTYRERQADASAKYAKRQQILTGVQSDGKRHRSAGEQLLKDTSPKSLLAALTFNCSDAGCNAGCGQAIKLAGSETVQALRELQTNNSEHINRLIPAVEDAVLSGRIRLPGPDSQAHFPSGVCWRAYQALLAIKPSRWNKLKLAAISAAGAGLAAAPGGSIWHQAPAQARISVKKNLIWAWIEDWLKWHGDNNPIKGAIMVNAQVIPASPPSLSSVIRFRSLLRALLIAAAELLVFGVCGVLKR